MSSVLLLLTRLFLELWSHRGLDHADIFSTFGTSSEIAINACNNASNPSMQVSVLIPQTSKNDFTFTSAIAISIFKIPPKLFARS